MRICYADKNFRAETLAIIVKAQEIIADYAAQGFTLTLRQLYYQFVARDLIENTERSYKRLGSIIDNARMAGLIDWDAIEDRTRFLREQASWETPEDIVRVAAGQFHIDRWANQKYRPEVWIEKDALIGVIEGVCTELDVPYFACRGYVSQSEAWRAGRRYLRHCDNGQEVVVFHLGDHDPSGIDMTRDNRDRLQTFSDLTMHNVRRLALNRDQVDQYNPPPNPAKLTDSRAVGYIADHGRFSWELDALEPAVIADLIRDNVTPLIDQELWDETEERERAGRARLTRLAEEGL